MFTGCNQPVEDITDHAPKHNDLYQYSILYYKIACNPCSNIYICSCAPSVQTDCAKAVKSGFIISHILACDKYDVFIYALNCYLYKSIP